MGLQGIFDPMVRAYFAGQSGGGSGGGSSDYGGLPCYDITKVLDTNESAFGTPFGMISNDVPNVEGKSCYFAAMDFAGTSTYSRVGEAIPMGDEDFPTFYVVMDASEIPFCVILPEAAATIMEISAGIWVVSQYIGLVQEGLVIFK